jgi:phosphate-selective porin OprO/OprP
VAGTYGNQNGALPKYVTPGQQTFFSYATGSGNAFTNVTAGGNHWRVVPQGYWYWGPFGLLGEYAISDQRIRRDAKTGAAATTTSSFSRVRNEGWQVAGSWVLTGEDNTFQGVMPRVPFSISDRGWGAWEVVGRVGQLDIDTALFPASVAAGSASKATSWGAGVNWYMNRNIKLALDYEQTYFKDGSSQRGTVTAQNEKIIFTRLQIAF